MFGLKLGDTAKSKLLQDIRQEKKEVYGRLMRSHEIMSNIHEYYQNVEDSQNIRKVRNSTTLKMKQITTRQEYDDMFQ